MTDAPRTAILKRLLTGTTSGPELASSLGVTRAAVWKHIEQLRHDGVRIDATATGYELIAIGGVSSATLTAGAEFDWEVVYAPQLESTNVRARAIIDDGGADCAIVTDEQTAARGRRGRSWTAPVGGIWLSVIHTPTLGTHTLPLYTLAAAVAVTELLRDLGVNPQIKWPNDIEITDSPAGKVAGILSEHHGELDGAGRLIIGIGVNLNLAPEQLPAEATTVSAIVGACDRRRATQQLLERLQAWIRTLEGAGGTTAITSRWREDAVTLGRRVAVELPAERVEGHAVDITENGALVVETLAGRRQVTAGDCVHLR